MMDNIPNHSINNMANLINNIMNHMTTTRYIIYPNIHQIIQIDNITNHIMNITDYMMNEYKISYYE